MTLLREPLPCLRRLADAPEKGQRRLHNAADILAPGMMLQEEPEGGVDRIVEGGLVESANKGLLLVERLGVVPGGNLGFDLRNVRPSVSRQIAAGAKDRQGRVDALGAGI